jgi:beta-hydroxyacyl-ACP dehydratase FabZ
MAESKPLLNVEEIQQIIPHRYPFLLVDKVLEMEQGKRILAIKNVTINEPFFQGHFPGHPIMPGVLIVEALAQTAGILLMKFRATSDKAPIFMSIDETRFRAPVKPGDVLHLEVEILRDGGTFSKAKGKAMINGQTLAVEAVFMAGLIDKDKI